MQNGGRNYRNEVESCGSQFVLSFTEIGTTKILMGPKKDYTPFIVCWSKNPSSPHCGLCNVQKLKGCEDFKDPSLSLENQTDNILKNRRSLLFEEQGKLAYSGHFLPLSDAGNSGSSFVFNNL
ncbi:uncharacterized protein EV154DRAFT_487238 [Mucor mucedo]|uniref:uncharacterized protein n=1 Tax=Mucor mucedo TaxID=29922 RepID=UPI002220D75B|nr:uncharacterized protein EV154DRAFT_487238 [Mucor mucedo]KAI7873408.1 hypothetical protein EV154DRAFT_487238 [Mucor mucedo]